MKNFLREYFTFNRRERRGILLLLILVAALLLWLNLAPLFFSEGKSDRSRFEKDAGEFQRSLAEAKQDSADESQFNYAQNDYKLPNAKAQAERFRFDPNNLPENDWRRLGLSDKQIRAIKNYESKGGKFRKKEDLKKMYCIRPELYASLEPYIAIPPDTTKKEWKSFEKKEIAKAKLLVELNSADTIALDKLNGIGFAFAKRIIRYREKLGGFANKEQLLEVFGMDTARFDGFSENISVDLSLVRRFNMNTATAEEMKKHPYIKFNLANLIVSYRKQHGSYKSVDDIKKLNLVNAELFAKLAPYLAVE